MDTCSSRPGIVRFAAFDVNRRSGELRKHGIRIKLARQPFLVLEALLERPQDLVTREELRDRLWPEQTIVDHDVALKRAVNLVRAALGDSAENPRFIETVPRRGYRFIGTIENAAEEAVSELQAAQHEPEKSRPAADQRRFAIKLGLACSAALVVVLAVISASSALRGRVLRRPVSPPIRSLAVLPLANLSGDPNQEYLADGLTDALIGELSQIHALEVISRTSVMRYKRTDKSLPEIARELGADAIVEGTLQRSDGRLRITAQLIRGSADRHIWSGSYDRQLLDILLVQSEIASRIAEEIRVQVTPQEKQRLAQTRPINLDAVEAYLQGQYHYQKAMGMAAHRGAEKVRAPELKMAVEFFRRAIAADPDYAPAYLGLGEVLGVPANFPYPPVSQSESAKEALRKALTIDPSLAQAHVDLGRIEYRQWNWLAAEREFKRALELNSNLPSAHVYYTYYLNAMGRLDEAQREAERAKVLEPGNDQMAWQFYCRHQFDRFIEMKRSDVARHAFGGMAHFDLGHGYERAHMYKEAVEEWEAAMTDWGYDDLAKALQKGYRAGGFEGAVHGWASGLEKLHGKGEPVHPDLMAYLYSIMGDKDRAFAWLEKSMEMHSSGPGNFKIDPDVDELRSDPRFTELMRRVGLAI